MPRGPGRAEEAWPGPSRGDDKDKRFLVDYDSEEESPRTGRARLENSADEWSPEDRPFTLRPMFDAMQQEREEQARQAAAEADDVSEDGGSPPRAEMLRRPRRNRATSRAILTGNSDIVDSSTT